MPLCPHESHLIFRPAQSMEQQCSSDLVALVLRGPHKKKITALVTLANLACVFNLGSISYSSHCRFGFELDFQRELTSQKPSLAASIKLQLRDQTKPTDFTLFPCKAINQLTLGLTLGQGLTERFMNLKESFDKLGPRFKFVMKPQNSEALLVPRNFRFCCEQFMQLWGHSYTSINPVTP